MSVHEAQFHERALLCVSPEGIIEWVVPDVDPTQIQEVALQQGVVLDDSVDVNELKYGEWLMPGFVDTHTVSLFSCLFLAFSY